MSANPKDEQKISDQTQIVANLFHSASGTIGPDSNLSQNYDASDEESFLNDSLTLFESIAEQLYGSSDQGTTLKEEYKRFWDANADFYDDFRPSHSPKMRKETPTSITTTRNIDENSEENETQFQLILQVLSDYMGRPIYIMRSQNSPGNSGIAPQSFVTHPSSLGLKRAQEGQIPIYLASEDLGKFEDAIVKDGRRKKRVMISGNLENISRSLPLLEDSSQFDQLAETIQDIFDKEKDQMDPEEIAIYESRSSIVADGCSSINESFCCDSNVQGAGQGNPNVTLVSSLSSCGYSQPSQSLQSSYLAASKAGEETFDPNSSFMKDQDNDLARKIIQSQRYSPTPSRKHSANVKTTDTVAHEKTADDSGFVTQPIPVPSDTYPEHSPLKPQRNSIRFIPRTVLIPDQTRFDGDSMTEDEFRELQQALELSLNDTGSYTTSQMNSQQQDDLALAIQLSLEDESRQQQQQQSHVSRKGKERLE